MLPPEVIKKITEAVRAKKAKPAEDATPSARTAAVKKMMSAIKSEDADLYLAAMSELRDIESADE